MGRLFTTRIAWVLLESNRQAGQTKSPHAAMRYWLLDRIRSFKPEVELSAVKNVTMTEEYLADHFPEFPVLPGVFMLEAATQAGGWLLRLSENFAHSIISLKEAKNVKYADFVAPGQTLDVTVSILKKDDRFSTMKVEGRIGDRPTLSGRVILERYNLADRDPILRETDERITQYFRRKQKLLLANGAAAAAG
jgi:3-hydroxyacyl-[acyl-carrier-protein] dehydratase